MNRHTDACQIITSLRTSYAGGKNGAALLVYIITLGIVIINQSILTYLFESRVDKCFCQISELSDETRHSKICEIKPKSDFSLFFIIQIINIFLPHFGEHVIS